VTVLLFILLSNNRWKWHRLLASLSNSSVFCHYAY